MIANVLWNPIPIVESTLFRITPSTANINEKPRTKYTVLRKILSLVDFLIVNVLPLELLPMSELWSSFMVVPDRYEINAGNIGRIQGEKNEPAPASADTSIFISTMNNAFANWSD